MDGETPGKTIMFSHDDNRLIFEHQSIEAWVDRRPVNRVVIRGAIELSWIFGALR
jgi:kynurenine formamidase